MSIESFISLSQNYAAAVRFHGECELLKRRVVSDYKKLDPFSKVRLFSIVHHHNYDIVPTAQMRNMSARQKVESLEYDVGKLVYVETGKPAKSPLSACAAQWIALELGNVPDPHALAADPQAPYPV